MYKISIKYEVEYTLMKKQHYDKKKKAKEG